VAKQPPHLVLLPGLDGTGELFRNFLHELPSGYGRSVVPYPTNLSSYADLDPIVRRAIPEHAAYVLLAESFSSPLAIQIASTNPGYLRGLILCGGFGSSPMRGPVRAAVGLAAPWLFRWDPHEFMLRRFLVGPDASGALIGQVREAIHQVPARVLANRLREVLRCDVLRDIRNIWVPILCLRGAADRLVNETCAKEILSQAQREESRSVTIEGPHLLLQARAAACVHEIADFLHHSC
jgi:pimeloyl-[acyl-carrier protein] methyl ester esterase